MTAKTRLNAHERRLTDLERAVGGPDYRTLPDDYYAPGLIGWHAEFVVIVRDILGDVQQKTPQQHVDEAETRARRARDENWGQSHVKFYDGVVKKERRMLAFWETLTTLTPDNATHLYNLILVHIFDADDNERVPMLGIGVQIACNRLRLYDTPGGRYNGEPSPFSPRLLAHITSEEL